MSKQCSKCFHTYSTEDFHRNARSADGRHCWCKYCFNAHKREYKRVNRDRIAAQKAEYRRRNPERVAAQQRRWYERMRAHCEWAVRKAIMAPIYAERRRQRLCAKARRRYARRRAYFVDKLGGRCVKCGDRWNLHFDHIDPGTKEFVISDGMFFSLERLREEVAKCQLLCWQCHLGKTTDERARR